jgi:hypothetical protein
LPQARDFDDPVSRIRQARGGAAARSHWPKAPS